MIEVPLNECYEIEFAYEASETDPFSVAVRAFIKGPGGAVMEIDGFYDGDSRYLVRILPSRIGQWSWRLIIDGMQADFGKFCCVPSASRGLLRIDRAHPRHFVYDDGSPFYPLGATAYLAVVAEREAPDQRKAFFDHYMDRSFNWFRFMLCSTESSVYTRSAWPWLGTPTSPDYSGFDPAHFRAAERVIAHAASRGAICSIILLTAADLGLTGEDRLLVLERYLRYAVARFGAFPNVVWNLFNEWNKYGRFSHEEVDRLGTFLRVCDPYGRLIACHHYARFEFYDSEWTDMASMQHRGTSAEVNAVAIRNRFVGKPIFNEEYGYEGDNLNPPNGPDDIRKDHWALAMAGAYGTYGDKTRGPRISPYFTCRLEDSKEACGFNVLQHLRRYMEKTAYRAMSPANEFIIGGSQGTAFCFAVPGHEYLVYMTEAQEVKIDLSHVQGNLSETWINPRTGEMIQCSSFAVPQSMDDLPPAPEGDRGWHRMYKNHCRAFTPPIDNGDWLLHLKEE